MKTIRLMAAALALVCVECHAITLEVHSGTRRTRIGEPVQCGKLVTVTADTEPGLVAWVVVTDDLDYRRTRDGGGAQLLFAAPCRNVTVRIEVIEFESTPDGIRIADQTRVEIPVVCSDNPDPPPDPDNPDPDDPDPPDPGGPFDGLAARVRTAVANMPSGERTRIESLMNTVVAKMKAFEIIRVVDAASYVKANFPSCATCDTLYSLLAADSKGRVLSWEESQAWYLEVAKGVKQ